MRYRWVGLLIAVVVFGGAASALRTAAASVGNVGNAGASHGIHRGASRPSSVFKHIVVIIQEDRTTDYLYNGFCVSSSVCADTVKVDPVSHRNLKPLSLAAPAQFVNTHFSFLTEVHNGFSDWDVVCKTHKPCPVFSYAPPSETSIYQQLATTDGVLADENFSPAEGPSVPNHLYAIAGQSGYPWAFVSGESGNCGITKPIEHQINMKTGKIDHPVPPCTDLPNIFDLLVNTGHTWRYYGTSASGLWSPTQMLKGLYNSSGFVLPASTILKDIQANTLADVSFVSPNSRSVSDHPGYMRDPHAGQKWVASIVNGIGESPYWDNTAVIVTWDDWGGLFDHVSPPFKDPLSYSFRVPLVAASAYARLGAIDHTKRSYVSALNLIEETFGLPSLGTLDQFEPGLDSMFDFNAQPHKYVPLR
ncbi:MAG: hypothetical protein JO043_12620 [Candidatus Eremiobacteraeota bacterium]|nr:hypothetical protein [Candidatus Eremiobacteraeota bacterium]